VTRLPQTLQGQFPLSFLCRTFEAFLLSFENDTEALDVFDSVKELTVARESFKAHSYILNLTLRLYSFNTVTLCLLLQSEPTTAD
jgi:hypothetical protein